MATLDLEAAAQALEQTPDYRVLRRVRPLAPLAPDLPADIRAGLKKAAIVDTETTGLDTATAKIIEFGIVTFWYDAAGVIQGGGERGSWFEDPGEPLSAEVTRVTGITDDLVRGQALPDTEVTAITTDCALIIAHNAGFDRPICERRFPWAVDKHWACSVEEIPWKAIGSPSSALGAIAASQGLFFDAHRAADDCDAVAALLARPVAAEGGSALSLLLASARAPTHRVWATNSPFECKDALKSRGYRWDENERAWYRDVKMNVAVDAETAWLVHNAKVMAPVVQSFNGRTRYSGREKA